MERDRPAPRRDALNCTPPAAAIPDRERVAPLHLADPPSPANPPPLSQEGGPLPIAQTEGAAGEPAVQVFPALEPDRPNSEASAVTAEAILAKIRARYDGYGQRLAHLRKQLKRDEPPSGAEAAPIRTYPTPFGTLSFQELYEHTRKYAAFALHHTYQVNAADLDDGLQAGYLRLWQRLQQQPDLLRDKTLAWIGRGIVYTALHATRGDWQFRRQTTPDGERALEGVPRVSKVGFKAHSRETRQVEMRIDLHRAIGVVAEHILTHQSGKRRDHDLWALYGLTVLQVSAAELSRLFGAREQSIQAAYKRVRGWLQAALPNYAPPGATRPVTKRGPEALPRQEVTAIRKVNGQVLEAVYEAVKRLIETTNADTRRQDELALDGIRRGIPAQTLARAQGLPTSRMQRAYERVHLMIGAQRDPKVRVRRPERRVKFVFTLTAETAAAVERLALDLLEQPKSYEKLVALHAHVNNLAISTTAKHFNVPTSTLRYYAQQIGVQLGTPTRPWREA